MIFERSADKMHIIGQQGGGKRVAGMPLIAAPVKGEGNDLRPDRSAHLVAGGEAVG